MPPRYDYWTIMLNERPAAFRAYKREDLMPTYRRLLAKHPSAVLMWFSKGGLWSSPEEEQSSRRNEVRKNRESRWQSEGSHEDLRARRVTNRTKKSRLPATKRNH